VVVVWLQSVKVTQAVRPEEALLIKTQVAEEEELAVLAVMAQLTTAVKAVTV
jgi:hypothetical protein